MREHLHRQIAERADRVRFFARRERLVARVIVVTVGDRGTARHLVQTQTTAYQLLADRVADIAIQRLPVVYEREPR